MRREVVRLKPGQLYSVIDLEGFSVVKVLAVDQGAVHLRWFKNSFDSRPVRVDPDQLTIGSVTDADGFGIAHVPMPHDDFRMRDPRLIGRAKVTFEDLEGYRHWQEEGGLGMSPFSPADIRDMVGDIFGDIPED